MQKRSNIFYARVLFKLLSRKVIFWCILFGCLGGLLLHKRTPDGHTLWGEIIFEKIHPVINLFYKSFDSFSYLKKSLTDLNQSYKKNQLLEKERLTLLTQLQEMRKLDSENKRLRDLLKVVPDQVKESVTARVLAQPSSLYNRFLLVGAGSHHGVEKGMAVVASLGVVGRVIEVYEKISRVLMITDLNSRVPVLVENSQDHAILSGDNTDYPLLTYAQSVNWLTPGTRILTSGYGGVFPPRLLIGTVSQIKNGVIRVQTAVDWSRLEFVQIVKFLPEVEEIVKQDQSKEETGN
jgi:rod shape-determining protein MreC